MIEPIRPDEVAEAKAKTIPKEVIESFNLFIAKNWNGTSSTFRQDDVVEDIVNRMMQKASSNSDEFAPSLRNSLFDNHHLDIEDMYRANGWKVEYDKPAYCETYPATFTFRKK